MAVFERPDSPFFWLWLEGYAHPTTGTQLRERTDIRRDAPTPDQRKANRARAERTYHKRMTELAEGALKPGQKPAITFRAFATWFATHVLPKRRGHERETYALARLVEALGERLLSDIGRDTVHEYMTGRLAAPTIILPKARRKGTAVQAGPATVNREVDLLKAVLQAAVPRYIEASPLYGMKRLPTKTPKRRILSEDEEARLLAVMDPDDKAIFLLGLDSLVRLGDLLDIQRTDVHGESVWIADPKAGGGFEVPISARTREAIDVAATWRPQRGKLTPGAVDAIRLALSGPRRPAYTELARDHGVSEAAIRKIARRTVEPSTPSLYLFARRRTAKTESARSSVVRGMLRRYCRAAGVPYGRLHEGITWHWSTRRTGATRMLTRGFDPGTVQKVGRWKDPTVVLGIYHELIDDEARAAVEAVGNRSLTSHSRSGKRAPKIGALS